MTREQEFWNRINITGDITECWEWIRGRNKGGYGHFYWPERYGKRNVPAHRIVWELTHGPIPAGMFVMHDCDNRPCCNQHHLILGTHQLNMEDMSLKGRTHNGNKTHCQLGHPYSEENTYYKKNGSRCCRTCRHYARVKYNRTRSTP